MNRKRIKKYNTGGFSGMSPLTSGITQLGTAGADFWRQEDMVDGNLSVGGALGSGALKGASMGAAFGPWGALAGGVIGAGASLLNRDEINKQLEAEAEAKRVAEEQRQFELDQAEKAANDAILENYPVKGVSQPRFALGGDTLQVPGDPKKEGEPDKKYGIFDIPKEAMAMVLKSDKVLKGLQNLNEDELQQLIKASIDYKEQFDGLEPMDAIKAFADVDLSWVKPLREKTGLSKGEIIEEAGKSGVIKEEFVAPLKAASLLKKFDNGGNTADAEPHFGQIADGYGYQLLQSKPLFDAWNKMSREDKQSLIDASNALYNEHKKGRTEPMSIGELTAAFTNADVSALKPLRKAAGMNKWQFLNEVQGAAERKVGTDNPALQAGVSALKPLAMFKEFAKGGPTKEAAADINLAPDHRNDIPSMYDLGYTGPVDMRGDLMFDVAMGGMALKNIYGASKLGWDQLLKKGLTRGQMKRRAMGKVAGLETLGLAAENSLGAGGMTSPKYMAEGGEMIQHQANDVPKTDDNGNLNRMTATEAEIKGDKHSAASGGVGMSDNKGARIYSDQLTVDKALAAKLSKL